MGVSDHDMWTLCMSLPRERFVYLGRYCEYVGRCRSRRTATQALLENPRARRVLAAYVVICRFARRILGRRELANTCDPVTMEPVDCNTKGLFIYRRLGARYGCDADTLATFIWKTGRATDPFTNTAFTERELRRLDETTGFRYTLVIHERSGALQRRLATEARLRDAELALEMCLDDLGTKCVDTLRWVVQGGDIGSFAYAVREFSFVIGQTGGGASDICRRSTERCLVRLGELADGVLNDAVQFCIGFARVALQGGQRVVL